MGVVKFNDMETAVKGLVGSVYGNSLGSAFILSVPVLESSLIGIAATCISLHCAFGLAVYPYDKNTIMQKIIL